MDVTKFEELQLDDRIIRAITEMGFEEASPIQAQAIPVVLEGRDMIGQAQTGTGKTAAFGLPLLQKVDPKVKKLQAIVLLPTRELAIQVAEELRRFAKFMHGIKVLPIYGGQDIVRQIRARGHRIFLDLKLHDIPNTVKKAMAALSALDVDIINLHAAGTKAMMSAALEGLTRPDGTRPLLIAVTQLTSTDQERMDRELLIHAPIDEVVLHYARNARDAGLDGVVCSPLEAGSIHARCGADFLTVTPGVRFADGETGDQKRVTTPERARELGSDYIVVGRPITQADDPVAAYRRCVAAFVG